MFCSCIHIFLAHTVNYCYYDLKGAIYGELQGVAHMVLDTSGLTGKAVEVSYSYSFCPCKNKHVCLTALVNFV